MNDFIFRLREVLRINAVRRLFVFAEMRTSEVLGLVFWTVLFALFEGVGLALILPILQYAESGPASILEATDAVSVYLTKTLQFLHLEPTLVILLIIAFIPNVLRNAVYFFSTWYNSIVSSRVLLRVRMKMVETVYSADPEFYSRHPVGELISSVMGQASSAGSAVLAIIDLFGVALLLVMYAAVLMAIDWRLSLVALVFAVIVSAINKRVLNWIAENALENARLTQQLMAKIVERMGQMQLIKLRHTKDQEAAFIREVTQRTKQLSIKSSRINASVEVLVDPIQMLCVFVTIYIGIMLLGSTLAKLGLLMFILIRLNARVKELNNKLRSITSLSAGVKLVNEMHSAAIKSDTIHSGDVVFEGLQKGISLKSVAFDYPDVWNARGELVSQGKSVIKQVDAEIPAGSFTALVGRSGAGKSTLVELFPRMRDATEGDIYYDDISIKDFTVGSLRRGVGYVTQTPMLFNDTVYENICYGLDYTPTDEQVRGALEKAHALFVYDLPHGLETMLGDRGVRFSGGERQRIAMARVLLQDTDILVFDEPTSALDSESEGYIQQTLAGLHGKKTLIVIAHRLATVVAADQLLVVDDGRIVERGTHSELIKRNGAYANLFQSQLIGVDSGA